MTFSKTPENALRASKHTLSALLICLATHALQAQDSQPKATDPEAIRGAVGTVVERENEAINTQQKINTLSDETQDLETEYKAVLRELEVVNRYNGQMREIIGSQQSEIDTIEQDLTKLQDTQREIVPLLLQMIEGLDQFITADTPFLLEERKDRVEELKELMDRGDVSLAEKYRKVFDAYQQENNLSRNIESTTGSVTYKGQERTVDFLRVGRVGLYFKSLDDKLITRWDTKQKDWVAIEDNAERLSILTAFKIARKEIPVDLLLLPVTQP